MITGRGPQRCEACRSVRCGKCGAPRGRHFRLCSMLRPRQCRACGGVLAAEDRERNALRCRACQPNVVTDEELAALYQASRARALRFAISEAGPEEAEDLVQIAITSLVIGRAALTSPLTEGLLVHAVKYAVGNWRGRAWGRRMTVLSPRQIEVLEHVQERARRGWR